MSQRVAPAIRSSAKDPRRKFPQIHHPTCGKSEYCTRRSSNTAGKLKVIAMSTNSVTQSSMSETGRHGMSPRGRGDINTYSVFAELNRNLLSSSTLVVSVVSCRPVSRLMTQPSTFLVTFRTPVRSKVISDSRTNGFCFRSRLSIR